MANVTAVYCLKNSKDRRNEAMYCDLARLLNRQIAQSCVMFIEGLFEAKKSFKCINSDPYKSNFSVKKGDYFLMVSGKDYDTNHWRLQRACRSEDDMHNAWPQIGFPEAEDFFELDEKPDDPEIDGNDYFSILNVILPESKENAPAPASLSENYVSVYLIHEATADEREDTWNIASYHARDFADDTELAEAFKQLQQCTSAADISSFKNNQLIIDEIIKRFQDRFMQGSILDPHHSLVIGVINGHNHYWRCGVWCYRPLDGKDVQQHWVDLFSTTGYLCSPDNDYIPVPIFD